MVKFYDIQRDIDVRSSNALINFFIGQRRCTSVKEWYELPVSILGEYERKELMRSKNFGKASVARLGLIMNRNGIYFKNESEYDKVQFHVDQIKISTDIVTQKILEIRSKEDFFQMSELEKAFSYAIHLSILKIPNDQIHELKEIIINRLKQSKKQ